MLGSSNRNRVESSEIILIDFGICKSWKNQYGDHVEPKNDIPFSGNLLFASRNAFLLKQQSRRDDLISLAYLLTFFIRGDLDWLKNLRPNDP